jgi:hypothetical protein
MRGFAKVNRGRADNRELLGSGENGRGTAPRERAQAEHNGLDEPAGYPRKPPFRRDIRDSLHTV